jgi:conjugative transfer signal peptidase TraF
MMPGWVAVGILGVAGLGLATHFGRVADQPSPGILVNETPSIPKGIYRRLGTASPDEGKIVGLHQPPIARAYLGRLGIPPERLLMKRLAARAGDTVCRNGPIVTTPRVQVHAHETDSRGRSLPSWAGCHVLKPDQVFVLGDTGSSFDSRYFGPVKADAITGVYGAVLSW